MRKGLSFTLLVLALAGPAAAQTSTPVQAGPLTFKAQTAPAAVSGRLYYDAACLCFKWYDGTAWMPIATSSTPTLTSPVTVGAAASVDPIVLTPVAKGAASFAGTVTSADLTAARAWTLPNADLDLSVTTANRVLATGGAGAGAPSLRALVTADLPTGIPWANVGAGLFTPAGPSQARTYTFPDASVSIAQLGANLFTGDQTLGNALYLSGKTAAGVTKKLIGVTALDKVAIDADALGTTFGGSVGIGTTSLVSGRMLTVAGGTQTTAVSPVYITQTVNAAAVAFPGIKFVMTEGGSGTAVGTNLLDLWYGTSGAEGSKFRVDKNGTLATNGQMNVGGTGGGLVAFVAVGDGQVALKDLTRAGFSTFSLGPTTGNTANGTLSIKKAYLGINIATDTGCAGKGTATITTTTGIPAGSLVLGVDANVTTTIAGSDGIASWALGHAGDTDAWGAALALAATTTTGIANFTVTTPGYFTGATNLTLTGTGGKKIDSGVLKITIYYIALTAAAAG